MQTEDEKEFNEFIKQVHKLFDKVPDEQLLERIREFLDRLEDSLEPEQLLEIYRIRQAKKKGWKV